MLNFLSKLLQRTNNQIRRHLNVIAALRTRKIYHFAAEHGKNGDVMDFGCGPGFGTDILAKTAKSVIGVDIRRKALNYARNTYINPNLSFIKVNTSFPLPFADNSFDVIISSHVIEHIPDVKGNLEEIKRILKPNGKLILSTPNRKHRLLPFQKPFNPYHFREYSFRSLKRDLKGVFAKFEILGIYGNHKISLIERLNKLSLRNPLKVYIVNPLYLILEKVLPKTVLIMLERPFSINSENLEITKKFDNFNGFNYILDDFIIGTKFKISVDLIAICYK